MIKSSKSSNLILFLYAILVLIGGIFGYISAGSRISLLMSALAFGLLMITYFLERKRGIIFAVSILAILEIFFAYRLLKTHAFFPAGLMTLATLVVIGLFLFHNRNGA